MSHYGEIHHKASDTFDKVVPHNLAGQAEIVAVTAFSIAEKSEPIARRFNRSNVEGILRKPGLSDLLKGMGIWQ